MCACRCDSPLSLLLLSSMVICSASSDRDSSMVWLPRSVRERRLLNFFILSMERSSGGGLGARGGGLRDWARGRTPNPVGVPLHSQKKKCLSCPEPRRSVVQTYNKPQCSHNKIRATVGPSPHIAPGGLTRLVKSTLICFGSAK